MYNLNWEVGFDGRAKLSDSMANALPCPPLATPIVSTGCKLYNSSVAT